MSSSIVIFVFYYYSNDALIDNNLVLDFSLSIVGLFITKIFGHTVETFRLLIGAYFYVTVSL